MTEIFFEILFILLLTLFNAYFSMAEVAIITSRKARLAAMVEDGDVRAKRVLALQGNRDRFLTTVQVGITLVGILSGVFGGATLADKLAIVIAQAEVLAPYSAALSMALVVGVLSFFTLVIGELIPKQVGLNNPESIATKVARPMQTLEAFAGPVIRLLTMTANLLTRVMRIKPGTEAAVSEDEVKYLVEQGMKTGIFAEQEHSMVNSIFRLGDRMVSSLMTPRSEIDWINIHEPFARIRERTMQSDRSRFPLCDGSLDRIIGVVRAKDMLALDPQSETASLKKLTKKILFVPENKPALEVLKTIKASGTHFVVVVDEYGEVIGLVTLTDILEAIVGEVPAQEDVRDEADAVMLDDGSWLVDGMMSIEEFREQFAIKPSGDDARSDYQTLGGMVMALAGKIPSTGDKWRIGNVEIQVSDMDGMRVDKVWVRKVSDPPSPVEAA